MKYSGMNEFYTPRKIVDCLPVIDLDPCSELDKSIPAMTHFCWPEQDGLKRPWEGTVFMNPPYGAGHLPHWCRKAKFEVDSGSAECVIGLVPARVGSKYWSQYIHGCADIGFIVGRLKFEVAAGVVGQYNASFDSAFVVWHKDNGKLTSQIFKDNLEDAGIKVFWYERTEVSMDRGAGQPADKGREDC